MMHHHRCSHMGVCSCGLFHNQSSNSFSMIFSSSYDVVDAAAPAAAGVDCTLSLGTPSTRLSDDDDKRRRSYVPNFRWDLLQCGQNAAVPTTAQAAKTSARPALNGGDPLLARRCANCDTTSTPLWRNGPRGPKSLCNACGIRFKKEERRANANGSGGSGSAGSTAFMEQQTAAYRSWVQPQKLQCYSPANEFRFMEDNVDGADAGGIPFLSWRLNVTDRPASLVHDFTR